MHSDINHGFEVATKKNAMRTMLANFFQFTNILALIFLSCVDFDVMRFLQVSQENGIRQARYPSVRHTVESSLQRRFDV